MDKEDIKNNRPIVQNDTSDDKNTDVEDKKNYDYLEPGDVYSFEVGM